MFSARRATFLTVILQDADLPFVALAVIVENGGYGSTAAAQVAGTVVNTALR